MCQNLSKFVFMKNRAPCYIGIICIQYHCSTCYKFSNVMKYNSQQHTWCSQCLVPRLCMYGLHASPLLKLLRSCGAGCCTVCFSLDRVTSACPSTDIINHYQLFSYVKREHWINISHQCLIFHSRRNEGYLTFASATVSSMGRQVFVV